MSNDGTGNELCSRLLMENFNWQFVSGRDSIGDLLMLQHVRCGLAVVLCLCKIERLLKTFNKEGGKQFA